MRFIYLLSFVLVVHFTLFAQESTRLTEEILFPREQADFRVSGQLPFTGQLPFYTYFVEWADGPLGMEIRFAKEANQWGEWKRLERDSHNREKGITTLNIGTPEDRFFQLRFDTRSAHAESAILHFYYPGETEEVPYTPAITSNSSFSCPCPLPDILSREEWCPAGNCPPQQPPASTDVTHLIVHHSAGTNSASDWAAIVRGIWDLHVNGNGWDDVGYNYLIDPNGMIYEGRGNNTRGAHFCGSNTGTMGVCVLGTFTNIEPSQTAIESLVNLLSWKSCDIGADPLLGSFHPSSGQNLMHISGHRDGCATACPGDSFYPLFPLLREGVNNQIIAGCSGLSGPINLESTEMAPTSYMLNWVHDSPNETGFQLERSLNGGDNYELRASLEADILSFEENDLELDRIYHYRIRAVNESENSDYSNVVIINTGVVGNEELRIPANALELSPNPASDLLQLRFNGDWNGSINIQILDLAQRVLLSEKSEKFVPLWQHALDIHPLSSGTYMLYLQVGELSGIWRFVKQ